MPLDEQLARFYLADVVNAVGYLHSHGFLHRDLKPENMVVDAKDGHLKLVDFGTAKNLTDPTLNGPNFVGTPEYMPPEVIANQEATSSSDLWAIGCILFQLLTGETPFSGGSAYLTFLNVQQGRVEVPAFVSDAARDLIMRLLVQDPTARLTIDQVKGRVGVELECMKVFSNILVWWSQLTTSSAESTLTTTWPRPDRRRSLLVAIH